MSPAIAERVQELADFREWARELRDERIEQRTQRPWVRLWDGEWKFRGQCTSELSASFNWKLNETGAGSLTLPIDFEDERGTFLAYWALEEEERETRNIHITVDKDGARWGGRMRKATLKRDPSGDTVVLEFAHDYEELKQIRVVPNPFLPVGLIQWPKVFMLGGPSRHCLKTALFLNLLRLHATAFELPPDPLDPASWDDLSFAAWKIVVKPHSLGSDSSPWTIVSSRMKSFHDMAAPILEDAELMVECRRWLTGDPEPWEGANLRSGTLVVDIVDKSGFRSGTSFGGNLVTGLTRAIANFTSNGIEDSFDLITGEPIGDSNYRLPGILETRPANPYVIYRDGDRTGIQSAEFSRTAAGPVRVTVGGRSMPGVNEVIEAAVGYAGDVIGDNLVIGGYGIGSLGGVLNAFLKPLYENSILAFTTWRSIARAEELGWSHYLETMGSGVTQAYTPSAIMDLRTRFRETRAETTNKLVIMDASPWLIGDQGEGHWFLGDRIGSTIKYLGTRVFVDRAQELDLGWSRSDAVTWQATLGDPRANEDWLTKLARFTNNFFSDLTELGVMG
jgi:hypothetical protein